MRRTDRAISNLQEIYTIMQRCEVCSLALFDDGYPYVIPLNFGVQFTDNSTFTLLFHCANAGTKLELIRKNPHAAFAMHCNTQLHLYDVPCRATMTYESVCGRGILSILPEEEKIASLTVLMRQYTRQSLHSFDAQTLQHTTVLQLKVTQISGKRSQKQ